MRVSRGRSGRGASARGRARAVLALCCLLVLAGCVAAPVGDEAGGSLRFADATERSGFAYADGGASVGVNGNEGVYAFDYDRDGWMDLLAVGGRRPVLFENDRGTFRRSGLLPNVSGPVQGALVFDYDGDGWRDLLLLVRHGRAVFLANEEGTFVRRDVGLSRRFAVPVAAAAGDVDGDGRLDVFVAQYGDWTERLPAGYDAVGDVTDDNGAPNVLLEWNGTGYELASGAGVEGARWSLAATVADFTGDGDPDVHVANDFNNDTLYVNRGDGTFRRVTLGPATARNGMSSTVADVNGDGRLDVFVTNIYLPNSRADLPSKTYRRLQLMGSFVLRLGNESMGNTLLVNDGGGRFHDAAVRYGVRRGGWGWAAAFADLDDDGHRDLFHATQRVFRVNASEPVYTFPMVWRRDGDRFVRLDASRLGFDETNGRGATVLDYDRDGDLDVAVAVHGGRFRLYENRGCGGRALAVDVAGGPDAPVGARVTVSAGGEEWSRRVRLRTTYQSQRGNLLHFGVGDHRRVTVRVAWPDGTVRTVAGVETGARLVVGPDGVRDRLPFRDDGCGGHNG
ncbi:MAG: CRTAC1 family protein [Halobacteriaceae archaeon]